MCIHFLADTRLSNRLLWKPKGLTQALTLRQSKSGSTTMGPYDGGSMAGLSGLAAALHSPRPPSMALNGPDGWVCQPLWSII